MLARLSYYGWFSVISFLTAILAFTLAITACTVSFQNLDTHGTTTDSESQATSPDISTQATIPLTGK